MADTMPKIRRYLTVKAEYGGPKLAIENESGEVQIIGDVTRPRPAGVADIPSSSGPSSRAAEEARAKKRAEEEEAFSAMVLRHLNDGLAMESGRRRLERGRKPE